MQRDDWVRHVLVIFFASVAFGCAIGQKSSTRTAGAPAEKKELTPYFYYMTSNILRKQSDIDKAVKMMGEAVSRDSDSVFLKTELAKLFIQQNDHKKALVVVNEILEENPNDLSSLVMKAGIHGALNQHEDAIVAYEKAIDKKLFV